MSLTYLMSDTPQKDCFDARGLLEFCIVIYKKALDIRLGAISECKNQRSILERGYSRSHRGVQLCISWDYSSTLKGKPSHTVAGER